MDWYTLRIISGKEKKVRENILFELEQAEMDGHIENILVPTENVIQMRDGKKKLKEKVIFPGNLLIQMDMNKETKVLIENVNGVISSVGYNHKPESLKPEEAQLLWQITIVLMALLEFLKKPHIKLAMP